MPRQSAVKVLAVVLFAAFFILPPGALGQTGLRGETQLRGELHIAAASDLQPVLPALAAAYEQKTGVHVVASFGSSATLAQQLSNGDPQDVFLAADFLHPEQLIAAGLATGLHGAKAPVPYATGVLVLWARKDSAAQPLSLDSLVSARVRKIAMANPLHAPYGLAAQRALEALHMTAATKEKLVVAENIGQTAQFAESGNAQCGLISLTTANSAHFRELGTFVRLPAGTYPPIQQTGVIMRSSKQQSAAEAFLIWLTSAEIQAKLQGFGLDPAN
jgi:molybdate transport system substrate-binding protein